jgi:hypothetical protein
MTLELAWVASQGAVRFTVTDIPDDDVTTVKRVNPGGTLSAIRGYPDGTWHGTSGLGYDYEAPLSVFVQYALVNRDAQNLGGVTTTTVDATNTASNPGLEGGSLNGWGSANASLYPVTLDSASVIGGTFSALSTRTATTPNATAATFNVNGMNPASWIPISNGVPVQLSFDLVAELDNRSVRVSLNQYDSSGAYLAATAKTIPIAATVALQRVRVSVTVTPNQVNAARGYLIIEVVSNAGNATTGERVWVDNLRIGGPDYFDGDTAPNGPYTYKWTGTAKASASQRLITQTTVPVTAVIFTETPGRANGEAWLRDIVQPSLSQPVSVVSTGEELYTARQTVLDVAGKSTPYVVWDSRQAKQGLITLAVVNHPVAGVYSDSTPRMKLQAMFMTGRPLLLSMCANKGFKNSYLAIDSVTYTRVGLGPKWLVELAYFEVDNPTGLQVNVTPEVTYANAQELPPSALYVDWAGDAAVSKVGIRYFDVATRTAIPS